MTMTNVNFVCVAEVRTRYFETGEGEPVVLFHGGIFGSANLAECAIDWELNFVQMGRRFRVFAPDKLGQGFTGNPLTDDDYTMAAVVQHAHGFLTALGLEKVHVVGHSRGGYLVCRLTLEQPKPPVVVKPTGARHNPSNLRHQILPGCRETGVSCSDPS